MGIRYCRKSFYGWVNFRFTVLKCVIFILLMLDIALMYCNKGTVISSVGFICIDLIVMLYFILRTVFVKHNITDRRLEMTNYSAKIFKRHIIIMAIFIPLELIHIEGIVLNIMNMDYDVKAWIWYAVLLPALYSDSVYLSGITAFGEEVYASGEYLIRYSDISNITDVCSKDTTAGSMVLMTLWNGEKKIGYDKMFSDEALYLKTKVQYRS